MRTESTNYRAQRLLWVTDPVILVRASYVREAGDATEYPFARDFTTKAVTSETVPKLTVIKSLAGVAQQADPVAGSSSIGFLEIRLGDGPQNERNVLRQLADPARPLTADIVAGATSIRMADDDSIDVTSVAEDAYLKVDDISGYPDMGHITIDSEDFSYTGLDLVNNAFTGVFPAQRDTTPAAHSVNALVRNGEQLRRGTRITLFLGYGPLAEADYLEYTKMEMQSHASQDFNLTWVIRCSDIQRFTKRRIFENATMVNPSVLGPDNPITLLLRVLLSTGNGSNGGYDVLPRDQGAAVPSGLVDITGWEAIRSELDAIFEPDDLEFDFNEIESQDAKEWIERQILRPLGILPYINQLGQYSGRLIATPVFSGAANAAGLVRATA